MKRINRNGFTKVELIAMLCALSALIALGVKLAVDSGKNYKAFRNLARTFSSSVALYKDKYYKEDNIYYLFELIDKGYSGELRNPLNTSETCDKYETYADIEENSNKKVILKCGSYLVIGAPYTGYRVYEITEWDFDKKYNDNDMTTVYNYKQDGKLVFSEYYVETEFIQKYFEKTHKMIESPFDIEDDLVVKNVYRRKILVKEIK